MLFRSYVLDTGVQSHSDLQGLSAIAALPGIHPVGCYSHASHVAGIIGAGDNGFGTVGVLPGVRLVSIALADVNDPSGACSGPGDRSASQSGLIKALEMVFWDTYWTQKVAVLNLSFNLGGGIFSRDSIIGQWMSFVATPFPSTHWLSYRGVLIVQSAGNSDTNACTQAYDGYSAGVLVVGGLDENGQRVRPLAGARNAYNVDVPDIVAEPGSNHNIPEPGLTRNDCVSLWAPSQRIKSTWGGNGYRTLSGTSMAAPHVAGFAARVLESDPAIWTSHDLAAAVRARAVPLIGSNLPMPHWHGVSQHTAPTLEISDRYGWGGRFQSSVRQINFMYPNGVFEDDLIHLRFEAEGAASCQVMWSNSTGTFSNYVWASSSQNLSAYLSPGFNSVRFTCRSSFGQQNSVEVVGYVKRNVKRVQWFARTISGGAWQAMQTGQSGFDTVFWSIAANEPFEQRYESDGADECAVTSNGITITRNAYGGPEVTEATLWDSVKSGWRLPPAYEFGTFYFGNPKTAPPPLGSFDGYRWHLTCKNSDGDSKTTMMQGRAKG